MRAPTLFTILAIILIIAVTGSISFANTVSSVGEVWILSGVVVVLCIGILLTGGKMRSVRLKEQGVLVEELSVSEARFQAIFNDAAVGVGIMGLDRRVIDANPAICRMFGLTREELIGMNASESTYPEDDPASLQMFNELVSGQRDSYEADRRYIRKNREVFWAHVTMSSVRGSDNKPRFLVGMVIDVDKQKRVALALEESEARFRAMFEGAALGIGILSLDRHVVQGNAAAIKMLGYDESELKNLNVVEHTYPEDRKIDHELFAELTAGKRDSYQIEKRYIHKDGRLIWGRTTFQVVKDSKGKPLYILVMVEDIDEQKQMQERIRESEARIRAMFDNAAVGMALMSMDRRVLQINQSAQRITGYSVSELLEMNPSMLTHPEDRFLDRELFEQLSKGERDQYHIEKRYFRKDGSLFWGRVTYTSVRNANGQPEYFIGMIEDITEQQQTHERQDWGELRDEARRQVFRRLATLGITDLESHIKFETTFTPLSWRKRYNLMKGSTHGLCHNLTQLGYFRPSNKHPRYHNLYFTGASTHPGTGMPTAMVSGRLSAQRIMDELKTQAH